MQDLGYVKLSPQPQSEIQKELTNPKRIPRIFLRSPKMEFLFARNARINPYKLKAHNNTIIWTDTEKSIIRSVFQEFSIHRWKMQAELELKTEYIQDLTILKPLLRDIQKHLADNRRLNINLHRCGIITDKQVAEITANISRGLTQLYQLKFHFSRCHKITDQGVQALAREIAKHSLGLRLLHLNFHNCDKIKGIGIESLVSHVSRYLPELKHLAIDFSEKRYTMKSPIENRTIEIIGPMIVERLTNLESLTLNFYRCNLVTPETIQALAIKISSNLKKLKKLDFSFSYNRDELEFPLRKIFASIQNTRLG